MFYLFFKSLKTVTLFQNLSLKAKYTKVIALRFKRELTESTEMNIS